MAKVLHSFSLNSYELRGYLNRCEGSQWMESFERKLVDLTCREILTTGEKGPNYILCISQRGKTYRWLTDFLFFFSHFLCRKSVNLKKFPPWNCGHLSSAVIDRFSLNCMYSCTRQKICIIIVLSFVQISYFNLGYLPKIISVQNCE